MNTVIIIPARYESSRFPGKPLAPIHGCPMVGRVILRARQIDGVTGVAVATDDERIRTCALEFQVPVLRTRSEHRTGTDRIAEAAAQLNLAPDTLVVNIQGDQPFFPFQAVTELIARHRANPDWPLSTLIYRITDPAEIPDPKHVKTVFDVTGKALYFSRSPIPCYRDGDRDPAYYKHLGIYAYRRDFLDVFTSLPTGPLEAAEKLEQLRALEHGYPVQVIITPHDSFEVDSPEDLQRLPDDNLSLF
ncbi:MAG: 3-deoxy-manno-octulosonate cytidylyltransferase [Deltaproteobacteria bacterium]|nr:3-deoxy-manno-octulosonate cytidylyltransferase [Deltaproteobacteria bacterium]